MDNIDRAFLGAGLFVAFVFAAIFVWDRVETRAHEIELNKIKCPTTETRQ